MDETPIPTPDGLRRYAEEMLADKPLTQKWMMACYATWAADKARIVEVFRLADEMCDYAIAKCIDPTTPKDGFLGIVYWQGQKDTARRVMAAAQGGEHG